MTPFSISATRYVELPEVLDRVRYCLRKKIGFSLVRVGDGENQVMAQGLVYSDEEIREIPWAYDENYTGVVLPNYQARDRLIESVKRADMVGVLHQNEAFEWKDLTEIVFSHYDIRPPQICYAFINIYMANNPDIIELIKNHRVLLIGKSAPALAFIMSSRFHVEVAGTLTINNFYEIPRVLRQATSFNYELALVSAGSNAVIIASILAQEGKVAIDFGSAMNGERWN